MKVVLDASAAVRLVLRADGWEDIAEVLRQSVTVESSALFEIEVAAALSMYVRNGGLTLENADNLLTDAVELVGSFWSISGDYRSAFHESIRLAHPPCDLLYLSLARRLGATLVTFDKKLAGLAHFEGISVVPR